MKKILVIGSGPTAVGHGTELNLAAWKACRLLLKAGLQAVVLDSTPASLALDSGAAARYVEPLTAPTLKRVLEFERPDAVLPITGGQEALNLCLQLSDDLRAMHVDVLGLPAESIRNIGDRAAFAQLVERAGGRVLPCERAASPEEAAAAAARIGFPVVLRPFFVAAGTGSSIVYNHEELKESTFRAVRNSPAGKTLVQKAALGWRQVICQVLRDGAGRTVSLGVIECVDALGVHSGDSLAVFPSQSLGDKQLEAVQSLARALADLAAITGSADVEFAIDPKDPSGIAVMEMNPGITRCCTIVRCATGFSVIDAAVWLALGERLDAVCPSPPEPKAVAVRAPRFSFEKFPAAKRELDTSMKSVGEVVALGRTFREAFQKVMRGPVNGRDGFGYDAADCTPAAEEAAELRAGLATAQPGRYFHFKAAIELGMSNAQIAAISAVDQFFVGELRALVDTARLLQQRGTASDMLRRAKADGFSDGQIAVITGRAPGEVAALREQAGVQPTWKQLPPALRYSSFDGAGQAPPCEQPLILMIGPGPNVIGSGSEYEYCVSRAALAFRELGYRCVQVNCSLQGPTANCELWDALYVVPLCPEEVLAVAREVRPQGVSVQFGGRVSIGLAACLEDNGFRILGTASESHRRCHCRSGRRELLAKLGLLQPRDGIARTPDEAPRVARDVGYPVVVRPLAPTPGKAMEVVYNETDLERTVRDFHRPGAGQELLIEEFLEDAIKVELDAVADGESILVGGIVEHIEEAGIHSGDSACAFPPYTVGEPAIPQMREQVQAIAAELNVRGLLNVQFAIKNDLLYVTEVLPSASLTIPFLSRASDVPLVEIAAKVTAGVSLKQQGCTRERTPQQMAVRHSVFPFAHFPGVDTVLGPEMKSTGQVIGLGGTFGPAFARALVGAGQNLPLSGKVFISLKNKDKRPMLFVARKLQELGFTLIATRGTAAALLKNDVKVELISKVSEGRPNIVDLIKNSEVKLIINTPSRKTPTRDEVSIRASAVAHNVPIITTVSGAAAAVNAIETIMKGGIDVKAR